MRNYFTYCRSALFISSLALLAGNAGAQLLQQDFAASTTVATYVNASTPTNGQWNAISTSGGGTVLSINTTGSNKMRFARTGNAGSMSRTTDFSPTPGTMMYRFDLTLSGNSAAVTNAATWQVGTGFGTANSTETNANTYARIGLNFGGTAGQFTLRDISTSTNSSTYSGLQTVLWVMNNSGATTTYRAPDGTEESIANDKVDIWIGTTREFNDVAVLTVAQTMTDLKFSISNGVGSVDQDNFLIDPIPAIPATITAGAVAGTSFDANWNTVSGVTGYSIDVATDAGFTSFVSGYNNLYVSGQATNTLSITGLSASTTYYYRVRGTSQYTVGSFSGGNSNTTSQATSAGGVNTSVQFVSTSSSIGEGAGSTNIALAITDFSTLSGTSVTIAATGATGRITSFTTPVNFPMNDGSNRNCVVNLDNNILCEGDEVVTLTITGISGGQGTAFIGSNSTHSLTVTDNDLCTSVEFVSATSSGTEGGGTVALTLAITNPSGSLATTVDVALTSGNAADVDTYTTQTATFPAGSSANQTVTITITDDLLCEGAESLTFTVQNIGGGQGTPFIGSQSTNVLTIADNDAFAATVQDNFEDGNFFGWVENAAGRWSASSVNPINGAYSLREVDQNVAGSSYISKAMGGVDLSTGSASWQWQNGYNNDPSTTNKFWFWIVANEANVTSSTVDGYAVGVNLNGSSDLVTLWRVDNGISGTRTAIITSTYDWNTGETGFRVTRSAAGVWELFLDTNGGFDALASQGTGTDATYTTMDFVAQHAAYSASLGGLLKFDDFAFSNVSCGNTYYSQSSGAVNDAIWSTAMVGTPGAVNFTIGDNMVLQNTHVITVNNDTYVRNLDVQTGSGLVLNTGITLSAFGTAVDLDGTITADYGSTLAVVGTSAVALGTTGTPTLSNLTISTANGTALTGNLNLNATLGITDGAFDATNGSVTLTSDATNTGNLGQVGATANYIGSITVQRYIPAGATNWRLLGSPVDGVSVGDWNDDFITAGFPGSDYPTFDSPVGSNILWPSVREYDETATGVANDGLNGVADMSDLLTAGKGFAAWCGTSLNTTSAFTVDVTGAPNIASGPIDLEVSFTAGSGGINDGWNLVSNPLPSAIDFTEVTLGANTYNGYHVYSPIDGTTEVWDEQSQSSSGLILNGNIASSQGFWLKTTAANPTNSSVDESAKVPGNGGPLFGGLQVPAFPIIRLNISSNVNTFSDNAVVVFDLGAPEFEPIDAPKMFFSDAKAPMIATLASTGEAMTFNKYGAITEGLSIPVKVQSYVAGTFTITAGISGNAFACMWLEDTQTGTLTALTDGAQYSFELAAGASTTSRFMIHSTAAVPLTLEPGFCGGTGSATVDLGANVSDITWTTPTGSVVLEQLGATGENTFSTTIAGNYTVHISTNAVCGELVQDLYIDIDETAVVAEFTAPATSVVNEAVAFTNTSTDYGTFFWNFGDNTTSTEVNPTHVYAEPGTYTVSLEVTADDCAIIITHDVVVSVSTGIATIASSGLNVWSNTQGIVMEHSFTEGTVKVEVLDATGRLHIQRQVPAAPGRTVIATDALNTGIWFVRVTNGDRVQSFRVPLVR